MNATRLSVCGVLVVLIFGWMAPGAGSAQTPTPTPVYLPGRLLASYTVDIPECYWGSYWGGWVPCYAPQGTPTQPITTIWSTTIRTFEFSLAEATWLALEVDRQIEEGRPNGWYIGNLGVAVQQLGGDGQWKTVPLPTTGYTLQKGARQPPNFDENWADHTRYDPRWQPLPPGQYRIFAWGQDVYDGNGALNAYWPSKGTLKLYAFDNLPPPASPTPTPFKAATITPTPAPGDLRISFLRIFQPFEGTQLGARRWTAVRVFPDFIADTATTQTRARVDLYVNGALFESRGPLTIKNQADYSPREIERGQDSINFFLPPHWVPAGGALQVRVVLDPDNAVPEPDETNNSKTWSEIVTDTQPLSLTVILLDPKVSPAAAQAWLDEARTFLLDTYPLPDVTIDYPFARLPGNLSLIGAMEDAVAVDLLRDLRGSQFGVGLFSGWPYGQGKRGFSHWLARHGPVVGVDWPYTLAHEIGHAYLGPDEEYDDNRDGLPLPEGFLYKQSVGSLRYVAPAPLVARTPQPEWINFMGDPHAAGINAWVAPDTYNRILHARENEIALAAPGQGDYVKAGAASASSAQRQKFILAGQIPPDGPPRVMPLLVLEGASRRPLEPGAYTAEVYAADGRRLSEVSFKPDPAPANGLDGSGMAGFYLELEYTPEAARVVILKEGREIYRQERSSSAPEVTLAAPEAAPPGADLNVTWDARDADGDALTCSVFYSADDGATWKPLALYWPASSLPLESAYLPGSSAARVRVVASDGFNFTRADSPPFQVARHAPTVEILPADPQLPAWTAGIPNALAARGADIEDGSLPEAAYTWESDRDGVLGQGHLLFTSLSAGAHTLTVTVVDRDGQAGSASLALNVQGKTPPTGLWSPLIWLDLAALALILVCLAGLGRGIWLVATSAEGGLLRLQKEGRARSLDQLRARDRRGIWWAFDPFQNRWLRWNGQFWQPTPPPASGRRGWGWIILSLAGIAAILGLVRWLG